MNPNRHILHLDMDAFFAAVEVLDNPSLAGLPVIVGSAPDKRGVICTCSYEARRFGVRSAMPSRTAYSLCPQGIFLPVRRARYQEMSRAVFAVLDRYTPDIEPLSIDEAFMDVTGSAHLWGGPVETAVHLRAAIREQTGLTASVGVAPNKFLAKIASDMDKPDGLTIVPREPQAICDFLAPLPIRRIWGVGRRTEEVLHRAAMKTVGDLQRLDPATLRKLVGDRYAGVLDRLCRGLDDRPVHRDSAEKSISSEHTYGEDVSDWQAVEQTLAGEADDVGWRLRRAHLLATTVHVKIRWQNFETITRQLQLDRPSHADRALRAAGLDLLRRARQPRPVRLVGFGVSGLLSTDTPEQPVQFDLFGETAAAEAEADRDDRIDNALDRIRDQLGRGSIKRGL